MVKNNSIMLIPKTPIPEAVWNQCSGIAHCPPHQLAAKIRAQTLSTLVKIAIGMAEAKSIPFFNIFVSDIYAIKAPKAKREINDRIPLHGSSIVRVVLARWTTAPSRKRGNPAIFKMLAARFETISFRGKEKVPIAPIGNGNIKMRNPKGKEIFLVNSRPKR
jgi:hypothetical protein